MDTLDLHGFRFDEAREAVYRFVDQLYFQHAANGRIIHGCGIIADALPTWLREYPFVARAERELHNPGTTLVWMTATP